MIFKLTISIQDINQYINMFSKDFDILFYKELYISDKNNVQLYNVNKLRKKYKIDNDIYIEIINENNLGSKSQKVIDWCRDKFVYQDLKRFENEHQEQIVNYLNVLDRFEEELKKYKNGGEMNGK